MTTLIDLPRAFERHLLTRGSSSETSITYSRTVDQFVGFVGRDAEVRAEFTPDAVEAFVEDRRAAAHHANSISARAVAVARRDPRPARRRPAGRAAGPDPSRRPAFARSEEAHADALLVAANPFFNAQRDRLVALAARHRLPALYEFRDFVEAEGLICYGADNKEIYRRVATYVDRILKGAKPADLPVEQPTKFELVINLRTAKALGLTIRPSLLARADQVIE